MAGGSMCPIAMPRARSARCAPSAVSGLRDAFSMEDTEDFPVSVGLFSDEQRNRRR